MSCFQAFILCGTFVDNYLWKLDGSRTGIKTGPCKQLLPTIENASYEHIYMIQICGHNEKKDIAYR